MTSSVADFFNTGNGPGFQEDPAFLKPWDSRPLDEYFVKEPELDSGLRWNQ